MKQLLATVAICALPLSASASNFDHDPNQSTFMNWINGYVDGIIDTSNLITAQINAVSDVAPDVETPDIETELETSQISNYVEHNEIYEHTEWWDDDYLDDYDVGEQVAFLTVNSIPNELDLDIEDVGWDVTDDFTLYMWDLGLVKTENNYKVYTQKRLGTYGWQTLEYRKQQLTDAGLTFITHPTKPKDVAIEIFSSNAETLDEAKAEFNEFIVEEEFVGWDMDWNEESKLTGIQLNAPTEVIFIGHGDLDEATNWDNHTYWKDGTPVKYEITVIDQIHTGNDTVIQINNHIILDEFIDENVDLNILVDVAEKAYEAGYNDGYQDGYKDGFADGVASVKAAVN